MDNFKFYTENKSKDVADINVLGYITDLKWESEDTTPAWFKNELDKASGAKVINLNINSSGGSVFAGLAIHNMIKTTRATVNTRILGIAASTASWMIMPSKNISMPRNAWIMMHLPSIPAAGNKKDLQKGIEFLNKIEDSITMSYVRDDNKITKDMVVSMINDSDEVWINADQALSYGLIDKIEGVIPVKNCADSLIYNGISHDKSLFKTLPEDKVVDMTRYNDTLNKTVQRLINLRKGAYNG